MEDLPLAMAMCSDFGASLTLPKALIVGSLSAKIAGLPVRSASIKIVRTPDSSFVFSTTRAI